MIHTIIKDYGLVRTGRLLIHIVYNLRILRLNDFITQWLTSKYLNFM